MWTVLCQIKVHFIYFSEKDIGCVQNYKLTSMDLIQYQHFFVDMCTLITELITKILLEVVL